MSKFDIFEDILLHFSENDIQIRREQVIGMLEALDINCSELVRLDPSVQEYLVEYTFNPKTKNRYYNNIDKSYYFATTMSRYVQT